MSATLLRHENANALYYALIEHLGREVDTLVKAQRDPVIALPTGNTMIPFYRIASEQSERLKVSRWTCFSLDEYYPIPKYLDHLSFGAYLDQHFFSRLAVTPKARNSMNGRAENFMVECDAYEEKIRSAGGLDLAILGIGTNGHIAFNEPGSEFFSRTRAVALHPETLLSNFSGNAPFTHALTLGIGTLLEAKKVIVVALGKSKAQAVRGAIREVPTRSLPASGLQTHPDVTWFLDSEAASLL
ncbi:MAG: glucosamine-6-phosphate deaminase [Proteobacteria bacterium]|nr:glucosamine-6-phosphate deaminase [Pseudomonadota bacterium]